MTDAMELKQELTKVKGAWAPEARAAVLTVMLPCGYVDAEGAVHQEMVVSEMTGHEEDLLGGKGPILQRLNQIILNCTVRLGAIEDRAQLGVAVSSLTASDRIVAFLAVRRASLGDMFEVKVQCPNPECKEEVRYNLNLAEVEIRPMADPSQRTFEHTLASGLVVCWHVMTSADEEWLTQKVKKKEDVLTLGLMTRVDRVNGEIIDRARDYKVALGRIKALPTRDRNEIRQLFEEHEGHVETVVDFSCPSCQHEWRDELNMGQPSFFFPSGA